MPGEDTTKLILEPVPLPDSVRRILIDRDMTGTFNLVNEIQTQLGLNLAPLEVWLPFPKPAEAAIYEDFYRAPVKFDQPWCQAIIRNQDMAQPLPGYNRTAQEMYQNQCDALLARRQAEAPEGLPDRVAAYLELFIGEFPGADRAAAAFDMPERSFRRRLGDAGRSYQKILDGVRLEKARGYLADSSRSVEEIAGLLGYSEPAAFIRAFERWTGQTPSRYRKAL